MIKRSTDTNLDLYLGHVSESQQSSTQMLKRILFPVISFVLAYNAYKLTAIFFKLPPEEFSLVGVIIMAVTLNILILGAIAFLGFVYPTHILFGKNYYRLKNPKALNVWYKGLGVDFFRIFLFHLIIK